MEQSHKKEGKIMAYENLELVIAGVSGDVYLAKVKNGIMDTSNRRVITDDVLRSSTEWFMKNDRHGIAFKGVDDRAHNLFYTSDPDKAEQIKAILKAK